MSENASKAAIAYYRVSTAKQGESGLGLEAQQAAVAAWTRANGFRLLAEFTEVESGKRADRPQLAAAIRRAKVTRATLVVAKLDRLARNVAFLANLMDAGVDFVAVDNPQANRLTIHILAAVAEAEAKAISERTRSALAAAKARGVKLGSARDGHWDGREDKRREGCRKANVESAKVRSARAKALVEELSAVVLPLREQGLTLQQVADRLNAEGYRTSRGGPWTPPLLKRLFKLITSS